MRKLTTLGLAAALLAGLMLLPGAATARKHHKSSCPRSAKADRNRDGLPDRWECRHRLSLRVNQARRDQDRDGLNNMGEFKAGTNPQDADTDNNGVKDGDENPGTIASFDAQTGTLVINLAGGGTTSGKVTSDTKLECEGAENETQEANEGDRSKARSARDGSDDGDPGGSGDENRPGPNEPDGQNNNRDDEASCSTADLKPGRTVKEAEIKVTSTGPVFEKIEIVV
jgi:hypothetical protein